MLMTDMITDILKKLRRYKYSTENTEAYHFEDIKDRLEMLEFAAKYAKGGLPESDLIRIREEINQIVAAYPPLVREKLIKIMNDVLITGEGSVSGAPGNVVRDEAKPRTKLTIGDDPVEPKLDDFPREFDTDDRIVALEKRVAKLENKAKSEKNITLIKSEEAIIRDFMEWMKKKGWGGFSLHQDADRYIKEVLNK